MQADLVAIDARALNLWPAHDPVATVLHAGVANIEAVVIAGRWRKRDDSLQVADLVGPGPVAGIGGEAARPDEPG
jgi:5-methylthioadenosine/S-adenosylhomocysteine deaminase